MSDILVNGIQPKIVLNGVEYSGGGSNLGTKTITENGIYLASDDHLDGYSQVSVEVSGGSFSDLTPLEYWYRDTDDGEEGSTPEHNLALTCDMFYINHTNTHEGYPKHFTHWNSDTKYIEIIRDFDAVLQYTLYGYRDSANYAEGALYYNDVQIAFLQVLAYRRTSVFIPLSLHEGDTLAIRKPEDWGWSYHQLYINYVGDPNV